MKQLKIFVVDDDPMQLEMIPDHLSKYPNYAFTSFTTGEKLIDALEAKNIPDIIILDYNLDSVERQAAEGSEILKYLKQHYEHIEIIMYSGQDNIEVAVDTMRYGAFDYVVKNATAFYRIENVIKKIVKHKQLEADARRYKIMAQVVIIMVVAFIGLAFVLRAMGLTKNLGWI